MSRSVPCVSPHKYRGILVEIDVTAFDNFNKSGSNFLIPVSVLIDQWYYNQGLMDSINGFSYY